MRRTCKPVGWVLVLLLLGTLSGCGGGLGRQKVKISEIGFSMTLPSGWSVDRQNPRFFFDSSNSDNSGMVEDYPLEGKTLDEYLDSELGFMEKMEEAQKALVEELEKAVIGAASGALADAFKVRIISRTPRTINGLDAVELVTEAAYAMIEVDIQKGDRVIRVSFRALKEEFPKHEPALREALESVKIE